MKGLKDNPIYNVYRHKHSHSQSPTLCILLLGGSKFMQGNDYVEGHSLGTRLLHVTVCYIHVHVQ